MWGRERESVCVWCGVCIIVWCLCVRGVFFVCARVVCARVGCGVCVPCGVVCVCGVCGFCVCM